MKPYYILMFKTDQNKDFNLKVTNCIPSASTTMLRNIMDAVVLLNAIETDGKGELDSVVKAQLINYETKEFNMNAAV